MHKDVKLALIWVIVLVSTLTGILLSRFLEGP